MLLKVHQKDVENGTNFHRTSKWQHRNSIIACDRCGLPSYLYQMRPQHANEYWLTYIKSLSNKREMFKSLNHYPWTSAWIKCRSKTKLPKKRSNFRDEMKSRIIHATSIHLIHVQLDHILIRCQVFLLANALHWLHCTALRVIFKSISHQGSKNKLILSVGVWTDARLWEIEDMII